MIVPLNSSEVNIIRNILTANTYPNIERYLKKLCSSEPFSPEEMDNLNLILTDMVSKFDLSNIPDGEGIVSSEIDPFLEHLSFNILPRVDTQASELDELAGIAPDSSPEPVLEPLERRMNLDTSFGLEGSEDAYMGFSGGGNYLERIDNIIKKEVNKALLKQGKEYIKLKKKYDILEQKLKDISSMFGHKE